MNKTYCNDNDFGPAVHGCRDNFDFTLLFETTILSIAPSLLVLLLATGRLLYLRSKPKLLWARQFQLFKLVSDQSLTLAMHAIYQWERQL
jgi:ATP-binding cassette subfamily C (CFTR/MRP) protein 1